MAYEWVSKDCNQWRKFLNKWSLTEATKIGVPDKGMSSFLSDTDYCSPMRQRMQTLQDSRAKWSRGIPWVADTKIGVPDAPWDFMVRLGPGLSYALRYGFLLVCPICHHHSASI